jgi:hypothetical protein
MKRLTVIKIALLSSRTFVAILVGLLPSLNLLCSSLCYGGGTCEFNPRRGVFPAKSTMILTEVPVLL